MEDKSDQTIVNLEESCIIQEFNNTNKDFLIFKKDNMIGLQSIKHKNWLPFFIDFSSNNFIRRKNQASSQEIIKAIGIKNNLPLKVLDTTAGQGRDSFVLASLGCSVTLLERNKVIYLLLKNAIKNAKNIDQLKNVVKNMSVINQDSIEFLEYNKNFFDVIYIDPMFPESNKSRLVKKDMQIFREIVGNDSDSSKILVSAFKSNTKRIVVKRMNKSDFLDDKKPNFSIKGTSIRFDVYIK